MTKQQVYMSKVVSQNTRQDFLKTFKILIKHCYILKTQDKARRELIIEREIY